MGWYPREKLARQGSGQARWEMSRYSLGESSYWTSQSFKEEEN